MRRIIHLLDTRLSHLYGVEAMKSKIGIFIPCYNVENSVQKVLDSFSPETLTKIDTVVAINNCSTDGTLKVLQYRQQLNTPLARKLVVIRNSENYGLGGSQKIAYQYFLNQGFTHFMTIHGDNQTDGNVIATQFLELLEKDPSIDVIMSSRFMPSASVKHYNRMRTFGNKFFNFLTYVLTGLKMSDAGAGVFCARTSTLKEGGFWNLTNSFQFNPQLNILLHENKSLKITTIPLEWRDSNEGSNIRAISYSLELSKILFRYGIQKYLRGRSGSRAFETALQGKFEPKYDIGMSSSK